MFRVSGERIRQIEMGAIQKLQLLARGTHKTLETLWKDFNGE